MTLECLIEISNQLLESKIIYDSIKIKEKELHKYFVSLEIKESVEKAVLEGSSTMSADLIMFGTNKEIRGKVEFTLKEIYGEEVYNDYRKYLSDCERIDKENSPPGSYCPSCQNNYKFKWDHDKHPLKPRNLAC